MKTADWGNYGRTVRGRGLAGWRVGGRGRGRLPVGGELGWVVQTEEESGVE